MSIPSRAEWVRWGCLDADRAEVAGAVLEAQCTGLAGVVGAMCAATADPDQALAAYAELAGVTDLTGPDPAAPGWRRLVALLGGSAALGRWLVRRPEDRSAVFGPVDPWGAGRIREDVLARVAAVPEPARTDELRWAYRWHLMRIAARDLTAPDPAALLETTCAELSDLADAVMAAAVQLAAATVPEADQVRFAVIGLGKTGAREANYLSDVDVMYVVEPVVDDHPRCTPDAAVAIGTKLATAVTGLCSAYTPAGTIWEVDANLRPEGAAGPLVRTLAGLTTYYAQWAKNWEFQAMLKARPMAGDLALGADFVAMVSRAVWAEHPGLVPEAQAMRARVVALIPAGEATRDIKLSKGGLRDTEFSVQLLQLVHGRADERLRGPATLDGLAALTLHGYVGRADGAELDRAYRFQRLLEHRLQLYHLKRTHLMPTDELALRRLARSVGLPDATAVQDAWRVTARTVLRLHQRLFYSPLLEAVARLPADEIRLTEEAAAVRLRALGYADPAAALQHIAALTAGLTRRADILRQLLPALLGWMAEGPNPDAGLLAFRQLAEALGHNPAFLRALRDEGRMAQNLARVLSTSRYAGALLQRSPVSVELLAGDSTLPAPADLRAELGGVVARYGGDPRTGEVIRATRRRELLRVAMAEILGEVAATAVGEHLSDLNEVTLAAALVAAARRVDEPVDVAIVALGSWGGREMSYTSDADLMVIVEGEAAVRTAGTIVGVLRQLLGGTDPDLVLDLDLRPEGKDGPLVRTLGSYRTYYERWAATWEAQALLRARHGAGDAALTNRFLADVAPVRYPASGLSLAQTTELRRLKARMETERMGRGVDPRHHLKLGPGGLTDVEWTVQLLQLQHAWHVPELQVTNTLAALTAARQVGLISEADEQGLAAAFTFATRLRHAITLTRNRSDTILPANATDLGQLAETLGYARAHGSHLAEDWHRVARHARAIVTRLFYGEP